MKIFLLSFFIFPFFFHSKELDDVETYFLNKSSYKLIYPGEFAPCIQTENLSELGKLTALHFLKWVEKNPYGVIALPTGKTPEFFIKYLRYYKKSRRDKKILTELQKFNIKKFPDTSHLKFVQLDEFFPINPSQKNSFTCFIRKYYIDLLDLKKENILTMEEIQTPTLKKFDLQKVFPNGKINLNQLKTSEDPLQKKVYEEILDFCDKYEKKIRKWGNIGFFLGGIGPDGHVAFNLSGSSVSSKTRLIQFNYPTAAASAKDLGGLEFSRDKLAVTIGLNTISSNPTAEIILFAAGEAKAEIIQKSIETKTDKKIPATAFQKNQNFCFYLTKSAAYKLSNRKHLPFLNSSWNEIPKNFIYQSLIDLSLHLKKPINHLENQDFLTFPYTKFLSEKFPYQIHLSKMELYKKLNNQIQHSFLWKNKKILHTSPHHDDIILSYYPLAKKLIHTNKNIFCTFTSGFKAVTNKFTKNKIQEIEKNVSYNEINQLHLESDYLKEIKILSKKITDLFSIKTEEEFSETLKRSKTILDNTYPGEKDHKDIQMIKSLIRETEEEKTWILSNVKPEDIFNLRLGFYQGNFFDPSPSINRDVEPVCNLIKNTKPDLITVAFDPEGTGPDTHYKVMQTLAEALKILHPSSIEILGYRNVWHRFSFSEADFFYFVTEEDLKETDKLFLNCYSSQKDASFPSHQYDGPFSKLMIKIQQTQLSELKTLLGNEIFHKNIKGLIMLKKMSLNQFIHSAKDLKKNLALEEKINDSEVFLPGSKKDITMDKKNH